MSTAAEYGFLTIAPFVSDEIGASSPCMIAVARTLAPTFALNSLGYHARAFSFSAGPVNADELRGAKAVVVADLGTHAADEIERVLRTVPGRVLYDLVDVPAPGTASYRFCLEPNYDLTAACEHVAQATSLSVGRPVQTIAEPYQGTRHAPRTPRVGCQSRAVRWLAQRAGLDTEAWRLRLLWSGDDVDVASIVEAYPRLVRFGSETPLFLHCIAPQGDALDQLADRLREEDPDALQLRLEAWSPAAMAHALAACDLVLLPQGGPASRSRLIAALHAGRLGIAHASPYHGGLAQFAWTGEDLVEGIRWSKGHPKETMERLVAGQRHLDAVHAPAVVAYAWLQLVMKGHQ